MANRKIVSVSLSSELFQFLNQASAQEKAGKSSLVEKALNYYRRYTLQKKLIEGFSNQTEEDLDEAMSDFSDYLKIIDK